MKKYLIAIVFASLIIIGNIWCYIENERLLNPMTNLVSILMLVMSYKRIKP